MNMDTETELKLLRQQVNDLTEQVTHLRRVNSMLTASLFAQGEVHVRGD